MLNPLPTIDLKASLQREAAALGFDTIGVTDPAAIAGAAERLGAFIDSGAHGDMDWLATNPARRADPRVLWADVRSVIMLGVNYGPDQNPLDILAQRTRGAISVYAQGDDYHELIKKRLKTLARWLHATAGGDVKVFVDTAAVMEKPLAHAAGLGWQGKHTNLVSREFGSWLFLGAIFTTLELPRDEPTADHCGSCSACLDICPTAAFPAPYTLDARRCISYLTIEHKGAIPVSSAEPSATASMAATIVSASARGTSLRRPVATSNSSRVMNCAHLHWQSCRNSMTPRFVRCSRNRRSSASAATVSFEMF